VDHQSVVIVIPILGIIERRSAPLKLYIVFFPLFFFQMVINLLLARWVAYGVI